MLHLRGNPNASSNLPITAIEVDLSSGVNYRPTSVFMVHIGGTGRVAYWAFGSKRRVVETFQAGDWVPLVMAAIDADGTDATGIVAYHWAEQIIGPDAPRNVRGSGHQGPWASLYWDAPMEDGGARIRGYQIRRGADGAWIDVGQVNRVDITPETSPPVIAGEINRYHVRAVNIEDFLGNISEEIVIDLS